jgi:hypothetical protein
MDFTALPPAAGRFLARRLERGRIRFVTSAVLLIALALLAVSFATSDRGRTWFRPPLGADYTGFYTAATILNQAGPNYLYDVEYQDQLYHELLPNLPADECLPYVHPPFVALAFRPLALLPYEWSFGIWLVISAGLYLLGLRTVWASLRGAPPAEWTTVLLLALSFEPFLMEAWQGGQLSAFGFCCLALAWSCEQRGRPFVSGLALGLCLYKPTLLVLVLPMMVVARRIRTLFGFAVCAVGLAGISLLAVGPGVCAEYGQKLLGFARTTTQTSHLILRTWKYVDLNSFLRLLLGGATPWNGPLLLALGIVPLGFLVVSWWRLPKAAEYQRVLVWAATLTATLVLNVYVGVYDTVLAVLGALLTAGIFWQGRTGVGPALPSSFQIMLLLLALTPWVWQPDVARATRVQMYTLVLLALAGYQLRLAHGGQSKPEAPHGLVEGGQFGKTSKPGRHARSF